MVTLIIARVKIKSCK